LEPGLTATITVMSQPSFPPDDPATQEGERLLGPQGSELRERVRAAADAAIRGEPAISADDARRPLSKIPGVADELATLDSPSPGPRDL
jgi:hypothetical protein